MARLHEYQGKAILASNGFKIPRGRAASTADEAVVAAKELASGEMGGEDNASPVRLSWHKIASFHLCGYFLIS